MSTASDAVNTPTSQQSSQLSTEEGHAERSVGSHRHHTRPGAAETAAKPDDDSMANHVADMADSVNELVKYVFSKRTNSSSTNQPSNEMVDICEG